MKNERMRNPVCSLHACEAFQQLKGALVLSFFRCSGFCFSFSKSVSKYAASPLLLLLSVVLFGACSKTDEKLVDQLNDTSYRFHYQNLDSTLIYANKAFELSAGYAAGQAEAMNNQAFVHIMRMEYDKADSILSQLQQTTNNQIELYVAGVQQMRLCQRQSKNKDFYEQREKVRSRQRRIEEERTMLTERENRRLLYANSEYGIVLSTYYYYMGLEQQSIDAIFALDADELENDTTQFLAYLYNVGAGGILTKGTQEEISQKEFDYLLRCFILANQANSPFWKANSMQAISEHLVEPQQRQLLIADNLPAMKFINADNMPDSLLAGYLAQKSLDIFQQFGDVYQTAGAYRTLASCYMAINDYNSALMMLRNSRTVMLSNYNNYGSYNNSYYGFSMDYESALAMLNGSNTSSNQNQSSGYSYGDVYGLTIDKLSTRTGPGTQYSEGGTYSVKGQWIKVLAKAWDKRNGIWWVKCEIPYRKEIRVLWTGWKRFDNSTISLDDLPEETW